MTSSHIVASILLGPLVLLLPMRAHANPADQARQALTESGVQGGLVVHLNCGDGKLTAALGANDRFVVHGLDSDPTLVSTARQHVQGLGLYGKVSIEQWSSPRLPYAANLVNLIVARDLGATPQSEVLRVLAPGGVALIGKGSDRIKTVKPRGPKKP